MDTIKIAAFLMIRLILLAASPMLLLIAFKEWTEDSRSLAHHIKMCWNSYWEF